MWHRIALGLIASALSYSSVPAMAAGPQPGVTSAAVQALLSGKATTWTPTTGNSVRLFFGPDGTGGVRADADKLGVMQWNAQQEGALCFSYVLPDESQPQSCGWVSLTANGLTLTGDDDKALGAIAVNGPAAEIDMPLKLSQDDVVKLLAGRSYQFSFTGSMPVKLSFAGDGGGSVEAIPGKVGMMRWDASQSPGSLCISYMLPDNSQPNGCGFVRPTADGFQLNKAGGSVQATAAAAGVADTTGTFKPLDAATIAKLVSGQVGIWTQPDGKEVELFFLAEGKGEARPTQDRSGEMLWDVSQTPGTLCLGYRQGDDAQQSPCGFVHPAAGGFSLVNAGGEPQGSLRLTGAFATVSLSVTDVVGQTGPGAFTVADAQGAQVGRTSATEEPLLVLPGEYAVEPLLDPLSSIPVQAAAGQSVAASYNAATGLWVTVIVPSIDEKTPATTLKRLAILRPAAERRAVLAARRRPPIDAPFARTEPRAGATAEDIEAALNIARAWFDQGDASAKAAGDVAWVGRSMAQAILIDYGGPDDVDRLIKANLTGNQLDVGVPPFIDVAALETRLGKVRDGKLAAMAQQAPDSMTPLAMAALAFEGDRRWDAALAATVKIPPQGPSQPRLAAIALAALWGARYETAHAAALDALAHFSAEEGKIKAAPAAADGSRPVNPWSVAEAQPLLLASDDPADLKVAAPVITPYNFIDVAPLFANPEVLFATRDPGSPTRAEAATYCGLLQAYDADAANGVADAVREEVIARATPVYAARGDYDPRSQAEIQFDVMMSSCRPAKRMADIYDGATEKYHQQGFAWAPEPWSDAEILKNAAAGTLNWQWYPMLDTIDDDKLTEGVPIGSPLSIRDLLLAFHKVMRIGTATLTDAVAYQTRLRRSFAIRVDRENDPGGSVSGELGVSAKQDGRRLEIATFVDARIALRDYGSLASTIASGQDPNYWPLYKYIKQPELLIRSVELRRFGKSMPLTEATDPNGGHTFQADIGDDGWKGLELFVTLAAEGQGPPAAEGQPAKAPPADIRSYAFDLFDTDTARMALWGVR